MATTLTKLYTRVLLPATSGFDEPLRPPGGGRRPIVGAWRRYEIELERIIAAADLTA